MSPGDRSTGTTSFSDSLWIAMGYGFADEFHHLVDSFEIHTQMRRHRSPEDGRPISTVLPGFRDTFFGGRDIAEKLDPGQQMIYPCRRIKLLLLALQHLGPNLVIVSEIPHGRPSHMYFHSGADEFYDPFGTEQGSRFSD